MRLPALRPALLWPPGDKKNPTRITIKQNVAAKVAASLCLHFPVIVFPGTEGKHEICAGH